MCFQQHPDSKRKGSINCTVNVRIPYKSFPEVCDTRYYETKQANIFCLWDGGLFLETVVSNGLLDPKEINL